MTLLLLLPYPKRTTSSTKPEVHDLFHCRQRKTEPQPRVTCRPIENFLKFRYVVFEIRERTYMHMYRQTDWDTDMLIAVLSTPPGSKEIICPFICWQADVTGTQVFAWCNGQPVGGNTVHSSQDPQQNGTVVDKAAECRRSIRWNGRTLLWSKLLGKWWSLITSSFLCDFYCAMLCIRGTSPEPVSVSVRLSQVGVLSKRLNESSSFLAFELPSIHPTLC